MNEPSNIERIVMRRVHTIRFARPLISPAALALAILALALWGIGREVWVARVFENGPQGFVGHAFYLVYAFEHTRILVQTLVVTTLAALLYLARETARNLAAIFMPAHA